MIKKAFKKDGVRTFKYSNNVKEKHSLYLMQTFVKTRIIEF